MQTLPCAPGPQSGAAMSPYLVQHVERISQHFEGCPDARWISGTCLHNNVAYRQVPCKRRTCLPCLNEKRRNYATRIDHGVHFLGASAILTLTYGSQVGPSDRPQVRKHLSTFIRWLRSRPNMKHLQYVAAYERQTSGRLHLHLVAGPWWFVPKAVLQEAWGQGHVWVQAVYDSQDAADHTTGLRESAGTKLTKFEQMVLTGRTISFSKKWPKSLPPSQEGAGPELAPIKWEHVPPYGSWVPVALIERGAVALSPSGLYVVLTPDLLPPCACFGQALLPLVKAPQECQPPTNEA